MTTPECDSDRPCIDPCEHCPEKFAKRPRTSDQTVIHWFKVITKTYGVCFEANEI